jgi:FolB domain-containing protein
MSEDLIEIRDLLLRGILGINPEEREKKQDILVNLTLYVDLRPAGMTDNIADTANYRTITKHVSPSRLWPPISLTCAWRIPT